MKFSRSLFFSLCASGVLLAQTAPPKPSATSQPSVSLSVENPKSRPVAAPNKVIISVGDIKITAAQFDLIIDALPEQNRANARGPGRRVFAEQLVRLLAAAQEGKRRKLDESPVYQMQTLVSNANMLAGLTFEQMNREVTITDADVRSYYETHKADFEQIHARQILVRLQGSPIAVKPGQKDLTEDEAMAKVQELRKKIQSGVDFATLALAESDDPNSVGKGGDMGQVRKGQMIPILEEAIFSLKPGELSQPVRSMLGFHLIKLEERKLSKTFEEARPELERKMRPEMAQKALDEVQRNSSVTLDTDFFGTGK